LTKITTKIAKRGNIAWYYWNFVWNEMEESWHPAACLYTSCGSTWPIMQHNSRPL